MNSANNFYESSPLRLQISEDSMQKQTNNRNSNRIVTATKACARESCMSELLLQFSQFAFPNS